MSIVAQKITYIHPDNQVLFKGIDLTITKGLKVALVGNNGSGKSTFLRILAGTLQAQEGEIIYPTPPYYVPQHFGQYDNLTVAQALRIDGKLEALRAITEGDASLSNFNTLADDWTIEERSLAALHAWGLEHILLSQPMRTLSGGEKTKVFLSGIEIHQPSILLLDEPTNHLDMPTIEWLEGYLKNYPKAVVIVSHDRMFLDRVIDVTYEIEYHRIRRYPGNYTAFLRQKEEALAKQEKDYEAQQAEIKRLTDWIEKWKNTPTKVAATRSKRKVIEHMVLIEKPRKFDTKAFQGQFLPQTASYHDVLSVRGLQIGYDSVLSKVSFELHRMERIAVIGENGKGKSTLLKTLVGELPKLGGQFSFGTGVEWGYFDQQAAVAESQNPKMTIMEDFWEEYPTLKEVEVRSVLGSFLFSGDDVYKELGQLSGGEKVRLALCKMFKRRPNLLILDEPTNHMDIVGKEALEQMLKSYTGTVLFVSHDRYFIKEIATGILDFQADKVQYYPCTYEEYLEQKQKEAQGLIGGNKTNAAGNSGKSRNVAGEAADNRNISQVGSQSNPPTLSDVFDKKTYYNPGKIISRLKQQLVKYEKMLGESEERLAELQMQQMDTALATDYEKLTELEQAIAAEQSNQESILDRLVETETELDEMQEKTV